MKHLLLLALLLLFGCCSEPTPPLGDETTACFTGRVVVGELVYFQGDWWKVESVSANHNPRGAIGQKFVKLKKVKDD